MSHPGYDVTWGQDPIKLGESDVEGLTYLDREAPELYQGYGEDHAEYLGEHPFADTIEEFLS